jgi:hypothetical protein
LQSAGRRGYARRHRRRRAPERSKLKAELGLLPDDGHFLKTVAADHPRAIYALPLVPRVVKRLQSSFLRRRIAGRFRARPLKKEAQFSQLDHTARSVVRVR